MKPRQLDVVSAVWKTVFAFLPNGFGKNACFQCLPLWKVVNKSQNREMVFIFVAHYTECSHEQMYLNMS